MTSWSPVFDPYHHLSNHTFHLTARMGHRAMARLSLSSFERRESICSHNSRGRGNPSVQDKPGCRLERPLLTSAGRPEVRAWSRGRAGTICHRRSRTYSASTSAARSKTLRCPSTNNNSSGGKLRSREGMTIELSVLEPVDCPLQGYFCVQSVAVTAKHRQIRTTKAPPVLSSKQQLEEATREQYSEGNDPGLCHHQ